MTATRATLRSRPPRQLSLGLLPRRAAVVGVRQSSPTQVQHHRESTRRQYALLERARALGWPPECVQVIDADLGCSGASTAGRHGFAHLTSEVVLGLEVSRLARNSADWYRLLDRCALSNTLLGDSDGVYHPALYNDRAAAGTERHHERGRAAPAARAPAGRCPRQGGPRRAALPAAGRLHLGLPDERNGRFGVERKPSGKRCEDACTETYGRPGAGWGKCSFSG